MSTVNQNTERLWDQLLQFIDEGRVIPVIGPELLRVEINGQNTLLYHYLAAQLARRLQLTPEPEDTLNSVTCRYLAQGGDREDIYPALKRVMPPLPEFKLPEALVKLAEIQPLKLFVTTSFDPLLAHALNQVRYGGQEKTQVLTFSPESYYKDLPGPVEQLDRTTVFHLFGNLSAIPAYAVTDEDVLEFMHALQSKTTRPELLFDALVKQNLIVIGCSFDDWLNRFFIRSLSDERLIISRSRSIFLCESHIKQVSESSPKIFLSYAREDKEQAKVLAAALKSMNWSVFWDPIIPPGKEWREVLDSAVNDADCVIVAWSKTSINSRWVIAEAEAGLNRRVLIPIMFDTVEPPFGFKHVQAADMVGWTGDTSKETFQQLISAVTKVIGTPSNQIASVKTSSENVFLQHFSSRTKIFPLESIEFVDELHRRWMESHPASAQPEKPIDDASTDKMRAGAVFLSYASEDRPAVILIRDALEQAGIDAWFDRNPEALRAGENFESKIKTNIDQCSLFVPIISRNTLTPKPRFFRTEWNHAQQLALRFPDSMRFIIPVAIDDTPPDASAVPEQFRKLHWERMPDGQASAEFVAEIKRLYRDYQRTLGQPA